MKNKEPQHMKHSQNKAISSHERKKKKPTQA
jgi:hypothetical protein